MKQITIFLLLIVFGFFSQVFANFDKVNSSSCSCSPRTFWVDFTIINATTECNGTKAVNRSGSRTWSCHENSNCSNPSCSYSSSCAAHQNSCSCSDSGSAYWQSYSMCRPRFACLNNPSVNITNAHPVTLNELPASYTLTQNYSYSLLLP
ncbi:hypothetical protein H6768_04050 [Candidatus Peribacteria bacterium]|nr:hypothetical protein [Candidatus Peribacteria bacterium]